MISLSVLELANNSLTDLSPISNLIYLESLDVSNNQIESIHDVLTEYLELRTLKLSYNKIEDINCLANLSSIVFLYLNNNNIKNIQVLSQLDELWVLDISFNNISVDETNTVSFHNLATLDLAFIETKLLYLFDNVYNYLIAKQNNLNTYIESLYLIIKDDLKYLDCQKTLMFIKRNIQLNLYYHDQIDQFLYKCYRLELDF